MNRRGTENDIEALVDNTYEELFKNLSKKYHYCQNEKKIETIKNEILKNECEEIIEDMNDTITRHEKKIKEIIKKYK